MECQVCVRLKTKTQLQISRCGSLDTNIYQVVPSTPWWLQSYHSLTAKAWCLTGLQIMLIHQWLGDTSTPAAISWLKWTTCFVASQSANSSSQRCDIVNSYAHQTPAAMAAPLDSSIKQLRRFPTWQAWLCTQMQKLVKPALLLPSFSVDHSSVWGLREFDCQCEKSLQWQWV